MNVGAVLILWGGLTVVLCVASALDHWLFERRLTRVQYAVQPRIRGGRWI